MKLGEEAIYALPLPESWLVYAPLHEISALVNEAAIQALRSPEAESLTLELKELRDGLIAPPELSLTQRKGDFLPDFIGLIPTRDCNLNCRYCGFRGEEDLSGIMPVEMAVQCVEWYARLLKDKKREILNVHFFGGEPFLVPELPMMAVHAARIKAKEWGLKASFEAATNGVMSEETAGFVGDFIDFIMLSIDGPPDIQNSLRPKPDGSGSFEIVHRSAKIFSEGSGSLCLRTCITSATVNRMQEIASWLYQEYRPHSISFETLQPSPESQKSGLLPPDPWTFALNFTRAASVLEQWGVEAVYATADINMCHLSFCPVSRDVAIISPDGIISNCYLMEKEWKLRGLDLNLGHITGTGEIVLDHHSIETLRSLQVLNKPRCRSCFCRWHCAGGCHVNHTFPGCADAYDELCIQTRIITLFNILKDLKREDVFENLIRDKKYLGRVIFQRSDCLSA